MTRGTFVFLTNDAKGNRVIYMTTEFNGGMYLDDDGYGKEVVDRFEEGFDNLEQFKAYVKCFNEENFQYSKKLVWRITKKEIKNDTFTFDGVDNFYKFADWSYHSDYYFWYNNTDDDIEVLARNGVVNINANGAAVFNYRNFVETKLDSGFTTESADFAEEAEIYSFMNAGLTREEAEDISGYSYIHEICGIYDDLEDYGRSVIMECNGVEEWLENYIDFERYGRDVVNDDGSKLLCSGRVITYS